MQAASFHLGLGFFIGQVLGLSLHPVNLEALGLWVGFVGFVVSEVWIYGFGRVHHFRYHYVRRSSSVVIIIVRLQNLIVYSPRGSAQLA